MMKWCSLFNIPSPVVMVMIFYLDSLLSEFRTDVTFFFDGSSYFYSCLAFADIKAYLEHTHTERSIGLSAAGTAPTALWSGQHQTL